MAWYDIIRFTPNDDKRMAEMLTAIDRAVRGNRLLEQEGLIGGLQEWSEDFHITVMDRSARIEIDLGPKSGEGLDFQFAILKPSGLVVDICVGEVLPEPSDIGAEQSDEEMSRLIVGNYAYVGEGTQYSLSLSGGKFCLSREETSEYGLQETYGGTYTVSSGMLFLTSTQRERKVLPGEVILEDCEPQDYAGSIDLSAGRRILRINAFDTTIELTSS